MANPDEKPEHQIEGFDPRAMFTGGLELETIDLLVGGAFRPILGRTLMCVMWSARDPEGQHLFRQSSVILPPANATELNEHKVLQAAADAILALRGTEPNEKEWQYLRRAIRVVHSTTLEAAEIEAVIKNEGSRRLIAVAEASKYRDLSIPASMVFGLSAVRVSEDRWVPHVAALSKHCVEAVRATGGYAIVHVAETPPENPAHQALLADVDGCYPVNLIDDGDKEAIVNRRAADWVSLAVRGLIGEAIQEINDLGLPEAQRLMLLVQLQVRAGLNDEALNSIEQLRPLLESLAQYQLVQLARFAHKAGDDDVALELLPNEPTDFSEEIWLEEGLELATVLEHNHSIERYDAMLGELFPNSERLRENRDRRLLMLCRAAATQVGAHQFTPFGFGKIRNEILDGVTMPEPDYEEIIDGAGEYGRDWLELAVVCCAMHARSVGHNREAADVASLITSSFLYGRQATQLVLSAVRAMMLNEEISRGERDYYRRPLQAAFEFLGRHPADKSMRSGLTSLLSVESSGDFGIPVVALTLLDVAGQALDPEGPTDAANAVGDIRESDARPHLEANVEEVLKKGLAWLHGRGAGEYGVTTLPPEIVGDLADETTRYLSRLVAHIAAEEGQDIDLETMDQMVLLACAIRPYAKEERNEDLRLMRLLAGQHATVGRYQRARDLVEQMLLMGQESAIRRRLAWLAFADVYQRCHNYVEALVGLACAMSTDVVMHKADQWQETYALVRLLRDLNLFELARAFLPRLRQLLTDLGYDAQQDGRIIATELGLRLKEIRGAGSAPELAELVQQIVEACTRANDRVDALPLSVLLGQAIKRCDSEGVPVDASARNLLESLQHRVGNQAAQIVQAVSTTAPLASEVVDLFNGVQRAMFAADVAADLTIVTLAARYLLDTDSSDDKAAMESALAVEVLADHTVPDGEAREQLTAEWPSSYAKELSSAGLDVAFLAVDEHGELRITQVTNGQIERIKQNQHEKPFARRLQAWLQDYPRKYGFLNAEDGNNEFFTTMEKLDIRLRPAESLVVVAEPLLQQLTSNVVVVEPEDGSHSYFYGRKTAVGVVPSLSWLARAQKTKRIRKTAYKAWISANPDPEATGTLEVALDWLRGTFEQFGFEVDTGRRLPQHMSDAGLALVTAHGGLMRDGRYIHAIRDEGDLVKAPSELAGALEGVELVILFVCSGGRIDKSPWENRTFGLPKQLLDKGTRAVIASPWPLDVKVTYTWLEPFLKAWNAGDTVLQATKKANDYVATRLGDGPQYSLAMMVYGDLLLTK